MRLSQSIALLLLSLLVQPVMAKIKPACPTVDQIKHIKVIDKDDGPSCGPPVLFCTHRFNSAPFVANGTIWILSFDFSLAPTIEAAQFAWDQAELWTSPSEPCSYYANWLSNIENISVRNTLS